MLNWPVYYCCPLEQVCEINRPVLSHIPAVVDNSSKEASSTQSFVFRLYEFALTVIVNFAFFMFFFCVFLYVIFLRFALPLIAPSGKPVGHISGETYAPHIVA